MRTFRTTAPQRGFTLIELMIAMLIGVFLMAGILQIFSSAKQAYRLQENLSRLQENGRFAMDYLTKGVRMAG
ncbi:MAG: prepilin-type N-terminal cleavage/methylation domain-containing protein, partial [Methylococcaceae bacterium]|nr:prepilin-type N-terminal cleavage/methylation domain-containing protein [Methylococcaceae bacterium]